MIHFALKQKWKDSSYLLPFLLTWINGRYNKDIFEWYFGRFADHCFIWIFFKSNFLRFVKLFRAPSLKVSMFFLNLLFFAVKIAFRWAVANVFAYLQQKFCLRSHNLILEPQSGDHCLIKKRNLILWKISTNRIAVVWQFQSSEYGSYPPLKKSKRKISHQLPYFIHLL